MKSLDNILVDVAKAEDYWNERPGRVPNHLETMKIIKSLVGHIETLQDRLEDLDPTWSRHPVQERPKWDERKVIPKPKS